MKWRKLNKHNWCKCAHDHSFDDMVTDDPYPMYEHWFVCAVRKDYQDYPENFPEDYNPCENCKHRQFSYEEIRKTREYLKESERYYKSLEKDSFYQMLKPIDNFPF
ncbi:MAG: hypothetical protein [Hatfieldvirus porci]|uniref:Uncharacterized protein n=1 Tax=phage Lak_Megaphage_RVC_JS4_GC31 TaxID=3109228 RepID=A0ABZ0Z2A2_9CAUD|nr:MAG: hypothetical protein [phage Lak_Megaphage_RVC_AP3_GC31]WQJ53191.1 MAG: hypothetical protein [phage Lak_Megaphage_RVC_JS4_GC31]